MNNNTTLASGVLLITLGLLAGCQIVPSEPDAATSTGTSGSLYDGEARVLYDAKQRARTSKQAMEFGEQALQAGDTDRALYQFVSAYELDSSQYMALHRVGNIHARQGKLERAALAFNLALQTKPDHAESLVALGLVEIRMRRYERAREHIERALESGSESWQAFNGLAVLADLEKDFESSEQYYQKALKLNRASPVLWNNLGYSRYLAGDWESAQVYIRKALDIDPGYEKAWLNLGLIHVRRSSYDEALDAFERVVNEANAYERVGSLTMMEGKYEVAEYFLNRAIDASPTYYEAAYDKYDRLKKLRGYGDDYSLAQAFKVNGHGGTGGRSPGETQQKGGGDFRTQPAGWKQIVAPIQQSNPE
jgi:tetratricopeptide (TPR) repeat protein